MSDFDVAKLLQDMEVDIAVDLNGHTQDARPGIFAWRPAPVQVNYLVYPGTTGADTMTHILADRIVLPADQQAFFSEKIVHLPDCYQANDATREIFTPTDARRCGPAGQRLRVLLLQRQLEDHRRDVRYLDAAADFGAAQRAVADGLAGGRQSAR